MLSTLRALRLLRCVRCPIGGRAALRPPWHFRCLFAYGAYQKSAVAKIAFYLFKELAPAAMRINRQCSF